MVDIGKAARIQEKEIRSQMDRMETLEALRHGNIYEVFAKSKTFKIGDFLDFFKNQHASLMESIYQPNDIKAQEAQGTEPDITRFPVHHREAAISPQDGKYIFKSMTDHEFKASKMKLELSSEAGGAAGSDDRPMTKDEVERAAQGTLDEWGQFQDEMWGKIFDAQLVSELQSKSGEMQKEFQRILALAKQGLVGPEFVMIALAKVNATRNGVLMTGLGKKAFHINESLSNIANDLKGKSNPAEWQVAQSRTRDGSFQMQLLMTDMQKVMQDTSSTIEYAHSFLGEWSRTKREIITKVAAN